MLWLGMFSSDQWIDNLTLLRRGFRLPTATMTAAWAAVATVAAAGAAAATTRLATVTAAATGAATIVAAAIVAAATVMATITAAAFLGSLSFPHSTSCLWCQRCNSQDPWIIRHLRKGCRLCIGALIAFTVAFLGSIANILNFVHFISCRPALAFLRLGILRHLTSWIAVTALFIALALFGMLFRAIAFFCTL